MTDQERVSLVKVIEKVKNIASVEYDDKVYDNILAIFNKLKTHEKRVFLRGLINIIFLTEDKIVVNTSDILEVKNSIAKTDASIASIEDFNKIELAKQMIKLKMLIVKSILVIFFTVIASIIVISSNISSNTTIVPKIIEGIVSIIKAIFGS